LQTYGRTLRDWDIQGLGPTGYTPIGYSQNVLYTQNAGITVFCLRTCGRKIAFVDASSLTVAKSKRPVNEEYFAYDCASFKRITYNSDDLSYNIEKQGKVCDERKLRASNKSISIYLSSRRFPAIDNVCKVCTDKTSYLHRTHALHCSVYEICERKKCIPWCESITIILTVTRSKRPINKEYLHTAVLVLNTL
jgi:hypothetical protein